MMGYIQHENDLRFVRSARYCIPFDAVDSIQYIFVVVLHIEEKINDRLTCFCYHFRRYVYRFVCDLQSLLGYTPEELHRMLDVKPEDKMTGD